MSATNEHRQLELEIAELERAIETETRQVKSTARASLWIGLALIAIVVCFVATNYLHVRSAFSKERLSASVSREARALGPVAVHELQQLGKSLLPVYATEVGKQIEAAWPEISAQLEQETREFCNSILGVAHETLAASQDRVLANLETTLADTFPGLKDPLEQERLRQKVELACRTAIGESIASFESLYRKDLERIKQRLLQLDVSDTPESSLDLQKKFIRLWLQLLDQEISDL